MSDALDGVPRHLTDQLVSRAVVGDRDYDGWTEVVRSADAERAIREAVEAALGEAAILAQGPLQTARKQAIRDCIAAASDLTIVDHFDGYIREQWVREVMGEIKGRLAALLPEGNE